MKKREIPTLREIRKKTGHGRDEFAARLGVSVNSIKAIDAGRLSISPSFAARVVQIYGVRPESLKTAPATDYDDRIYTLDSFRKWRDRADNSVDKLTAISHKLLAILGEFLALAIKKNRGPAALIDVAESVNSLVRNFGRPFEHDFRESLRTRMPESFSGSSVRSFRAYIESIVGSREGFEAKLKRAVESLLRPATQAGPGSRRASKRIIAVARALYRKEGRRTPAKVVQPFSREIRTLRDGSIVELYSPPIDLRGVISIRRPIS